MAGPCTDLAHPLSAGALKKVLEKYCSLTRGGAVASQMSCSRRLMEKKISCAAQRLENFPSAESSGTGPVPFLTLPLLAPAFPREAPLYSHGLGGGKRAIRAREHCSSKWLQGTMCPPHCTWALGAAAVTKRRSVSPAAKRGPVLSAIPAVPPCPEICTSPWGGGYDCPHTAEPQRSPSFA